LLGLKIGEAYDMTFSGDGGFSFEDLLETQPVPRSQTTRQLCCTPAAPLLHPCHPLSTLSPQPTLPTLHSTQFSDLTLFNSHPFPNVTHDAALASLSFTSSFASTVQKEGNTGVTTLHQKREQKTKVTSANGNEMEYTDTLTTTIHLEIDLPTEYEYGQFITNTKSQCFMIRMESAHPVKTFQLRIPFVLVNALVLSGLYPMGQLLHINLRGRPIFEWKLKTRPSPRSKFTTLSKEEKMKYTHFHIRDELFSPRAEKSLNQSPNLRVFIHPKMTPSFHQLAENYPSLSKAIQNGRLTGQLVKDFGQEDNHLVRNRSLDFPIFWDPSLVDAFHFLILKKEKDIQQEKKPFPDSEKEYLHFLKGARQAFNRLYHERREKQQPSL